MVVEFDTQNWYPEGLEGAIPNTRPTLVWTCHHKGQERGREKRERVCRVWGNCKASLFAVCGEREIWRSRTRAFLCHWKFSWMRVGLQEYWWSFLFLFLFVSVCCNNDLDELCSVLILLGFSSWSRVCAQVCLFPIARDLPFGIPLFWVSYLRLS